MPKRNNPKPRKSTKLAPVPKSSTPAAPGPPDAAGVDPRVAVMAAMEISTRFSGPLPPPEVLERYNAAVPDAAERILRMAEQQAVHRQQLEAKVVTSDIWKSKAGLVCGFLIAVTAITVGGLAVHAGHG